MGMCVAGLGVLGVSAIYLITGNVDVLSGFSLGAVSYTHLDVYKRQPQVTYIMHDLKEKGFPVRANVTTVEEAAREIVTALEKKA